MFLSIKYLDQSKDSNNMYLMQYMLEDTEFTLKIHVPIEKIIYDNRGDASIIPSGIITTYNYFKQSVPKNLAIFYGQTFKQIPMKEQLSFMEVDKIWTDTYFPELEYGKKYYNCTLNQIKVLRFTGKYNHV